MALLAAYETRKRLKFAKMGPRVAWYELESIGVHVRHLKKCDYFTAHTCAIVFVA